MSHVCPRCGTPLCRCECKKDPRIWDTPWNGEPMRFELSEHVRAFTEKMMGHLRREWAYRRLAGDLLHQLKSLENFVDPSTRNLLKDAREVWEKQLNDIAKL